MRKKTQNRNDIAPDGGDEMYLGVGYTFSGTVRDSDGDDEGTRTE